MNCDHRHDDIFTPKSEYIHEYYVEQLLTNILPNVRKDQVIYAKGPLNPVIQTRFVGDVKKTITKLQLDYLVKHDYVETVIRHSLYMYGYYKFTEKAQPHLNCVPRDVP